MSATKYLLPGKALRTRQHGFCYQPGISGVDILYFAAFTGLNPGRVARLKVRAIRCFGIVRSARQPFVRLANVLTSISYVGDQ